MDAAVSVQRAAAACGVESVSCCCSCLDVSFSSLQRSTSVYRSVVDGRSSVTSTCTTDDSCALLVDEMSSLLPEHTDVSVMSTLRWHEAGQCRSVELSWMRSILQSTGLRVSYDPTVTVYHVHGRCNSVYCSVSWD